MDSFAQEYNALAAGERMPEVKLGILRGMQYHLSEQEPFGARFSLTHFQDVGLAFTLDGEFVLRVNFANFFCGRL